MKINNDPFHAYRTPQSSFNAVTGSDGRSLTLTATDDLAQFHPVTHLAIEVANKCGWRVTTHRRHPGGNVESLMITPRR